uniref:BURP domain-containing protein n=1 Tax=Kalanchoe fedtschenkoi TaxID=63787 RepID=A0A7N0TBT5_KALFE
MDFLLHAVFALLSVSSVARSQDASPAQLYWKAKLPNTPIPKAVRNFLPEAKSLTHGGENFFMASGGALQSRVFNYMHAATEENLAAGKIADVFFFHHQLKPGTKLRIQFLTATRKANFLPAELATTMPLTSKDLPQILTRLAIDPDTKAAALMNETVSHCEAPSVSGETQKCAASLEQLVDFSVGSLGGISSQIEVKSTEVEQEDGSVQEYTIMEGVERVLGNKTVACHTKDFAYPVFICHAATTRMVYSLPLAGADGRRVDAAVACHTNTAQWDPSNLAFQMLKVKPGGSDIICHFLPEDHIIWGTSD